MNEYTLLYRAHLLHMQHISIKPFYTNYHILLYLYICFTKNRFLKAGLIITSQFVKCHNAIQNIQYLSIKLHSVQGYSPITRVIQFVCNPVQNYRSITLNRMQLNALFIFSLF